MKRIFVLMAALMIVSLPSFAQKEKPLKKGGEKKEMVKPKKDKTEKFDKKAEFSTKEMEAEHEEDMKMKRDFLNMQLKLDEASFQKFWDMYENYNKEMFVFDVELAEMKNQILMKNPKAKDDILYLPEEDANIIFDKSMETEKRKFEAEQVFRERIREILKPQQILKLRDAEKRFAEMKLEKKRLEKDKRDKLFSQPEIKKR